MNKKISCIFSPTMQSMQWRLVENAEISNYYTNELIRFFQLYKQEDGQHFQLTGTDVETKEPLAERILHVSIKKIYYNEDKTEPDYHMVFHSKKYDYVLATPSTLYSPYHMEIMGVLILIYNLTEEILSQNALDTLFIRLAEFLIFKYDQSPKFFILLRKALGKKYPKWQDIIHEYFLALNTRKSDLLGHPMHQYEFIEKVSSKPSEHLEMIRYPLTDLNAPYKMFIPIDVNDPLHGKYASELDVSTMSVQERRNYIDSLSKVFRPNTPYDANPIISTEKAYANKKRMKLVISNTID